MQVLAEAPAAAAAAAASFASSALSKQIVTYLDLVAATILGYDYILTFRQEITLVWPAPWTIGKVLFFLTRYPVFAETSLVLYHQFAVMGPNQCNLVFKTIGYQLGTGTLIAESILAVRTWVIWRKNGYIAIALVSLLVLFWTPVFYFLAQALNSLVFRIAPDPTLPGCFLQSQKNILFAVFILISSFETIILVLTFIKCWDHFRHTSSSLAKVLYRDGIMNYVYLFMLSIMNMVILLVAPHAYSTTLSALQRVMHAVLSGRVLLHLREVAVNRSQLGSAFDTVGRSGAVSEPHFLKPEALGSALQTSTWFGDEDENSSHLRSRGAPHSTSTIQALDDQDEYSGWGNKA